MAMDVTSSLLPVDADPALLLGTVNIQACTKWWAGELPWHSPEDKGVLFLTCSQNCQVWLHNFPRSLDTVKSRFTRLSTLVYYLQEAIRFCNTYRWLNVEPNASTNICNIQITFKLFGGGCSLSGYYSDRT